MAAVRTQPPVMGTPVETEQPDIETILAEFGEAGARVKVFRKVVGQPMAYLASYDAADFTIEALARDHGGGTYECQVIEPGSGRVARRRLVEIDRSIPAPARRRPPAPVAQAWPQSIDEPAAVDPTATLARQVAELTRVVQTMAQGGAAIAQPQGITMRDLFDIIKSNQPAAAAGLNLETLLGFLPKMLDLLKPKSTLEELFAAQKLLKSMKGDDAGSDEDSSGEGVLLRLLDSPLGQVLAQRFVTPTNAAATPSPVRQSIAPSPQLPPPPATSPQPATSPPPAAAAPAVSEIVSALVPLIVEGLAAAQKLPDFDPQNFAYTLIEECGGPEIVGATLDDLTPGAFASALINAGATPPALVYMLEGMVRTACEPADEPAEPAPVPLSPPIVPTPGVTIGTDVAPPVVVSTAPPIPPATTPPAPSPARKPAPKPKSAAAPKKKAHKK
jgi:hypothetical protein